MHGWLLTGAYMIVLAPGGGAHSAACGFHGLRLRVYRLKRLLFHGESSKGIMAPAAPARQRIAPAAAADSPG